VADRKRIYDTRRNMSRNSQGGGGASSISGGRGGGRSEVQGGSTSGSATPASGTSTTPASGSGTTSSTSANTTVAISSNQDKQRVTNVNAMSSTQPLPKVTYEDHVALDSGASDHMHSRRQDLTDIVEYITECYSPLRRGYQSHRSRHSSRVLPRPLDVAAAYYSAAEYVACPWSTDDSVVRYPICAVRSHNYLWQYDRPHYHA